MSNSKMMLAVAVNAHIAERNYSTTFCDSLPEGDWYCKYFDCCWYGSECHCSHCVEEAAYFNDRELEDYMGSFEDGCRERFGDDYSHLPGKLSGFRATCEEADPIITKGDSRWKAWEGPDSWKRHRRAQHKKGTNLSLRTLTEEIRREIAEYMAEWEREDEKRTILYPNEYAFGESHG